ncbi:MAG: hypothetical protein HOL27_00390 [Candidatus Marinimicrobia bacterium]|nr:hypothetical protein [Candidatus Neomarinimicrobiota bacterium]MBT5404391.1 hypothetical protein [Candidatus Neomarinimicrobiota bacterium]
MGFIYLPTGPQKKHANFSNTKETQKHLIYQKNSNTYLYPKRFDQSHINPKTLQALKNLYSIDSILIEDQIKNASEPICITDHVNKSGINFLRGETPYKNYPTFPDQSQIYHALENLKQENTYTVGPDKFETVNSKKIISKTVGIISPVWHYVGVQVFAIGKPINA